MSRQDGTRAPATLAADLAALSEQAWWSAMEVGDLTRDRGGYTRGGFDVGYRAALDAALDWVGSREWAEAFLTEWARPYFGDDVTDAVACVQRAGLAALRDRAASRAPQPMEEA